MAASVITQALTGFTYSNVEETYSDWDISTSYSFEVSPPFTNSSVVTHRNFYWRSTSFLNTGNEPIDENGNVSSEWIVLGPANLSSILDLSSNSKCTITGEDLILEFTKTYEIQALVVGRFMGIEIKIEYLDALDVVIATDIYDYSSEQFNNVIDDLSYDYAPLVEVINRNKLIRLQLLGEKIRLTLKRNVDTDTAYLSFLTAGEEYALGQIDGSIDRNDNSYIDRSFNPTRGIVLESTILNQGYSFELLATRVNQIELKRKGESLKEKVNTYILDNRENSEFENIISLAKLKSAGDSIGNADYIKVRWSIEEAI